MRRTGVNNKKRFTVSIGLEKRSFGDCDPKTINDNMDVVLIGNDYCLTNLDTGAMEPLPFNTLIANGWYSHEHDFWKTPFEWVNQDKIEQLAKLCSAFNHSFEMIDKVWEYLQPFQQVSSFKSVSFRLQNPTAPEYEQHKSWMQEKLATGWTLGPVRSNELKTHPNLVPYSELTEQQRAKDKVFKAICSSSGT